MRCWVWWRCCVGTASSWASTRSTMSTSTRSTSRTCPSHQVSTASLEPSHTTPGPGCTTLELQTRHVHWCNRFNRHQQRRAGSTQRAVHAWGCGTSPLVVEGLFPDQPFSWPVCATPTSTPRQTPGVAWLSGTQEAFACLTGMS